MSFQARYSSPRVPLPISGQFGSKPTTPIQTPTPSAPKPTGAGFGTGLGVTTPKPPKPPTGSQFSFGSNNINVEPITKSLNPNNIAQFGDEIASGVGNAISSSIDDFGRLIGRAGGLLGTAGTILGAASIGASIADFANWIDPGGKAFLDDYFGRDGSAPGVQIPQRQTSGFIPGPIPPAPTRSPSKTPTQAPTKEPGRIGAPILTPTQNPVQSPAQTPTQSPGSSPGSSPSSRPFTPPAPIKSPSPSPSQSPLPQGAGGVNLNLPIWQRLNELEKASDPDLSPVIKAIGLTAAISLEGIGKMLEPIFTMASLSSQLISGLQLGTSIKIPQAMGMSATLPSALGMSATLPKSMGMSATLPKSMGMSATLPKSMGMSATLPKSMGMSATLPKSMGMSAILPQKTTNTALINQLLQADFALPNQELEFDINLGQKNFNFELDLGEKEIEITIPAGKTEFELDVDLKPLKEGIEKCKDGHKKTEEQCKETGKDIKKIKEKLEIEFPEIEGEGEIVCRDNRTPYAFKGKGLKGLQQMMNVQMELSKNILTHICNGLQQQQETLSGALDFELCEKTESGDLIIQGNTYEGVGLRGIQNQINALANINKYIIKEVCKHGNTSYPVYADPHLEEFPVSRQLTFTLVESRFYPYQEGSLWHMTIPQPRPNLDWEDFEGFQFWKGTVFGRIIWQNSKIWSGGYFRDADEARRVLTMMEELSLLEKSGDFRIGTGGNPRKPQVREVRAVRAVVADLSPVTGDPETVLAFVPPTR